MTRPRWTRRALVAPVVGVCLIIVGVVMWVAPQSDTSSPAGATADGTTAPATAGSGAVEQTIAPRADTSDTTAITETSTTESSTTGSAAVSDASETTAAEATPSTSTAATSSAAAAEPATVPAADVTWTSPPTVVPSLAPPPSLGQQSAAVDSLPMRQHVAPVALSVDAQSISAPIVPVGAEATDGELEIPATSTQIGWYQFGSAPGEAGSAVLAAHVDWKGRLGVFYNLRKVEVGSIAVVTLEDGSSVRFSVTEVIEIDKGAIPDDRIFRRDGPPQLVLITCGGHFNSQTHHYDDNIIAFANPI